MLTVIAFSTVGNEKLENRIWCLGLFGVKLTIGLLISCADTTRRIPVSKVKSSRAGQFFRKYTSGLEDRLPILALSVRSCGFHSGKNNSG